MRLVVNIHKGPNGEILVVSDREIIGKKFEEGRLQLDLTKRFYQGEEKEEEEIKKLAKGAYVLHLTGKKTIELFISLGLVDKKKVLWVARVPHGEVCLGG